MPAAAVVARPGIRISKAATTVSAAKPDGSLDPDRPSGAEQVHDKPPRRQR